MVAASRVNNESLFDAPARACYSRALRTLRENAVPFVVGGAFALHFYTGITRHTKDLDIFTRPRDVAATLEVLRLAGFRTEWTYRTWLAKGYLNDHFIDLIFNLGNGVRPVDDEWFAHALTAELFGEPVFITPPEEMLWSKAFTMARDRYDGADVAHLLRACGERLDWPRLVHCFGEHWPVLYSHLILFGYIYPGERGKIPTWVMQEMASRLKEDFSNPPAETRLSPPLCRGPYLGGEKYHVDTEEWGYQDARLKPWGTMTPEDLAQWKEARSAGK
jgi:hypothetical protein